MSFGQGRQKGLWFTIDNWNAAPCVHNKSHFFCINVIVFFGIVKFVVSEIASVSLVPLRVRKGSWRLHSATRDALGLVDGQEMGSLGGGGRDDDVWIGVEVKRVVSRRAGGSNHDWCRRDVEVRWAVEGGWTGDGVVDHGVVGEVVRL